MGAEVGPMENNNAAFIRAKLYQDGFFSLNTGVPSFAGAILERLLRC